MPRYATPPLPEEAERIVTLGINRTKVAILLALGALGGTAKTADIAREMNLAEQPIRSTLLRHLWDLERAGYVSASQTDTGTYPSWTIHPENITADLSALMAKWTPTD